MLIKRCLPTESPPGSRARLPEQWAAYKARRAELQHRVDRIDATVASDDSRGRDVAGLASLRQQYLTELQSRAPFTVSGMVGDLLNEIWLISYLSLGLLVAFWLDGGRDIRIKRVLLLDCHTLGSG